MLITVLVMALAVSLEPFRIGMTVLMLNRPRPALQLIAFLCGGFAMGMSVGLVVLFVLRRVVAGSNYFTLPTVQIAIGALALAAATVVALNPLAGRDVGAGWVATWAQRLLAGPSLWVAGVAGLGIALPSVDYLAALAVVLASGAPALRQFGTLALFNVAAFRVRGDTAGRRPRGTSQDALVDGGAERVDPVSSAPRGCGPACAGRRGPARGRCRGTVSG